MEVVVVIPFVVDVAIGVAVVFVETSVAVLEVPVKRKYQ
jgi:hypothetical protein